MLRYTFANRLPSFSAIKHRSYIGLNRLQSLVGAIISRSCAKGLFLFEIFSEFGELGGTPNAFYAAHK